MDLLEYRFVSFDSPRGIKTQLDLLLAYYDNILG